MNGLLFAVSDVLVRALENTVMGICIVFLMLVLISFIISLLKFVNRPQKKTPAVDVATTAATADTEESDDEELVAVITAAIYEYEKAMGSDVPAGGLVVRSIRKVNKSRWQNA